MTAIALSACATPANVSPPIVRLFELQTPPNEVQRFADTTRQTMLFAHEHEPYTLAMYSLRKADNPQFNYVFEIYQDDAAYQIHTQSEAFKHYRAIAPQMVNGRKVIETEAQFLYERGAINLSGSLKKPFVRLAKLTVQPEQNAAFKRELLSIQKHFAKENKHIAAIYSVSDKAAPNVWYLLEVYDNEAAFNAVTQSKAFTDYRQKIAPMIAEREAQTLNSVCLTSKGSLK